MMKQFMQLLLASLLIWVTGCNSTSSPETTLTPELTPQVTEEVSGESGDESSSSPITLNIWLPPEFGTKDSTAYEVLQERLNAYSERHPGVRVEVRVKDIEGPASLTESLKATSQAAPMALPDLVALPATDIQAMVDQKLIYPFGEMLTTEVINDWFDFGPTMSMYDEEFYALPFAANAMVLVYRPSLVESPPTTWNLVLETPGPLAFPAGDPDALFTIGLYQSQGTRLGESEETPVDATSLVNVFEFYDAGRRTNLMPYWLTQFEDEEIIWQTFQEGRASMAVVWSVTYLSKRTGNMQASFLPTQSGIPYTLVDGWAWTLTASVPERQAAATELGLFLSEGSFTAGWVTQANYLPTTRTAMDTLGEEELTPLILIANQVLPFAELVPGEEIREVFGLLFKENTIKLLKNEISPQDMINDILEKVGP